ncbi:MAG: hypothetical protein PHE33_07585 [Bacteroidales bacterium]|nr:hypothetical protein [Bacteroidales bacterium]
MTIDELINKINEAHQLDELSNFVSEELESINILFNGSNYEVLKNSKFKISDIFYDIKSSRLKQSTGELKALLNIFADFFERCRFCAELQAIFYLLDEGPVKNRVKASLLYLRINDVSEYVNNFEEIIEILNCSYEEEDFSAKITLSLANYYYTAQEYLKINFSEILISLKEKLILSKTAIPFFTDELLDHIINDSLTESVISEYIAKADNFDYICDETNSQQNLLIESSEYSERYLSLKQVGFDQIIHLSYDLLPENKYSELGRGTSIIDNEDILLQYVKSYGKMHKCKLVDSFDSIDFNKYKNLNFDIVDWGCGQALASTVLFEYFNNNNIKINVESLLLIEPSEIAIKRGILHLSQFIDIRFVKTIIKDFDSICEEDIYTSPERIKLHLLSNVLDIPTFNLRDFIAKIKKTQKGQNIFVCISPFIDENKSMRLDAFYKNFNDNYETQTLSTRVNRKEDEYWNCSKFETYKSFCDIHSQYGCNKKWTRYEKVFITNLIY